MNTFKILIDELKKYVQNKTKNKCIQTEMNSFELQANVEKNTHKLKRNCQKIHEYLNNHWYHRRINNEITLLSCKCTNRSIKENIDGTKNTTMTNGSNT